MYDDTDWMDYVQTACGAYKKIVCKFVCFQASPCAHAGAGAGPAAGRARVFLRVTRPARRTWRSNPECSGRWLEGRRHRSACAGWAGGRCPGLRVSSGRQQLRVDEKAEHTLMIRSASRA